MIQHPIFAVLSSPDKWTKGTYARDADGHAWCEDDEAVCFCVSGALQHAHKLSFLDPDHEDHGAVRDAILTLYPSRVRDSLSTIPTFNDHPETTYDDILAVLHHAFPARPD